MFKNTYRTDIAEQNLPNLIIFSKDTSSVNFAECTNIAECANIAEFANITDFSNLENIPQ